MEPADVVLRFLESVGRADEAQFYLALFRAEAKETFAALHIDASVGRVAADAVALELSFLAALGLTPVVTLGLFAPAEAAEQARALERRLGAAGVPAEVVADEEAGALARRGTVPIVVLEGRVERLGALLNRLASRKLIFVNRAGGFRLGGVLVPIVNLTTEADALMPALPSRKQQAILGHARRLVLEAPHRMTVAVTAPLDLMRELFTVKGAGTLLRRGAVIVRRRTAEADAARLTGLLESSFGKTLAPGYLARVADGDLHLEESYRGAALLVPTPLGAYLSKFAVDREAQGEGLGRDLWDSVAAAHARIFWRARRDNPIGTWYGKIADGFQRQAGWQVFWRGLPITDVPAAVAHAVAQPVDLL